MLNSPSDNFGDWGLGIGDWGLGDWGLGPIPNPQSPIPNKYLLFFIIILSKTIFFIYML